MKVNSEPSISMLSQENFPATLTFEELMTLET